ncbi:hypothetical protein SAMN06272771_0963 [Streptomyces sp. Ag82_O1-12]|uniref:hypothetical protein n=1 Tax=unclassified Streptomyces TaxID=2593676 RepID=UPI000BDB3292|nr:MULTISPECIES: hypothetical protein [unclassified Streptomyces]SMQ14659.1 hypothetical protein SAMN06272771_0963 [Streptomyces sp. Ag82_O1-12]SOD43686.1 hypothetical protein SAMN06272727_0954 [Streptomyces sp. Ag82_G6-1]
MSPSPSTTRSVVANLLLWAFFGAGLAVALGAGAVLDGTPQDVATITGSAVALVTGTRLARKPGISAFLARPGTLWFLFLFNGGAATAMYVALDGVKGTAAAAAMGLVSLGAAGGIVARRRRVVCP